jgi:hypothetical protein
MNQVKLERQFRRWDEGQPPPARPYYGLVRDDLAHNILNGKLRPGVGLRMARVRVWNTIMEDRNSLVRRWVEFLNG